MNYETKHRLLCTRFDALGLDYNISSGKLEIYDENLENYSVDSSRHPGQVR